MKFISSLKSKNLSKETVLLRVDLNVKNLNDSLRLEAIIPTVKFLLGRDAKVVILSHRGRPQTLEGQKVNFDSSLTLSPSIPFLSKNISAPIKFIDNFDFEEIKKEIKDAPQRSVFMLENLRFLPGEDKNDPGLAKSLASLGTIYINDAFAVSHRKNASVVAIAKYLPSYAGLLFEKEYKALSLITKKPKRPLIFIIGGAKAADKIPVIKSFLKKADAFLLGGAVANTLLKAKGVDVKNSLYDEKLLDLAANLIKNKKIILPKDWETENFQILDISSATIAEFKKHIKKAKTIVWNGPLGLFETPRFRGGSKAIAEAIAESKAYSVVGGGETTQFIKSLDLQNKISFLSTAGGAMLEFLAGQKLPGIEVLK